MRIFDINNIEITSPDLSRGYLAEDRLFVAHHEAIDAVEEQGHYEVIAIYPETGGRDVNWVVDVPGVEAQDAWDEYENIYRYVPYTAEELDSVLREPLSISEKLRLIAEAIEEEPYPDLPPENGYKYQRVFSITSKTIVWILVPDQYNPIEWNDGMSVTENLYYTDGENLYLCVKSGESIVLGDEQYFKQII